MNEHQQLPHLKVTLNSPNSENYRYIMDGNNQLLYIKDVGEFYSYLGYTKEIAKARILPDEFVWDEYINNDGYSLCLQRHILHYLLEHSSLFDAEYGGLCALFEERHKEALLERGKECAGCMVKKRCGSSQAS